MKTPAKSPKYIPALRFHWLTPAYDRLLRVLIRERPFKARIVAEVAPQPGHRILDFGCGTGTLTLMLANACPEAAISAVDIDDRALALARKKAEGAGADIAFHKASIAGERPPDGLGPGTFDCVVSSLVFHHLSREEKRRALRLALQLLKPGGHLVLADWGKAGHIGARLGFLLVQMLDGFATTADNVRGQLPALVAEAGFDDVRVVHSVNAALGTLSIIRAVKA